MTNARESSSPANVHNRPSGDSHATTAILRLLDRPLSERDLREATQQVSQPLPEIESRVVRLLLFRLGDEDFAIPAQSVDRVTRAASVHRIPHRSNRVLKGLCNIGGELMLCCDLAALMQLRNEGKPVTSPDSQRMIVVGASDSHWGFAVDSVHRVVQLVSDTIRRPPITVDEALGRLVTGLVSFEGRQVALLDESLIIAGFQAALT